MRQLTGKVLLSGALLAVAGPAFAGAVVPIPLAGAFGPAGLAVAGVGYGAFVLVRRIRARR